MGFEETRNERIEFAIELLCDGLPRQEIQKQIRKEFDCTHNTARKTVTQSLDKLSEKAEKFNDVDSKIGFIEQKYHDMLKRTEKLKSPSQRMNMELSILRDLGNLIGANHHVKERILLTVNNNLPTSQVMPIAACVSGALKRIEEDNNPEDTIIEISPDAADILVESD